MASDSGKHLGNRTPDHRITAQLAELGIHTALDVARMDPRLAGRWYVCCGSAAGLPVSIGTAETCSSRYATRLLTAGRPGPGQEPEVVWGCFAAT